MWCAVHQLPVDKIKVKIVADVESRKTQLRSKVNSREIGNFRHVENLKEFKAKNLSWKGISR